MATPFLKWAGGKGRLAATVVARAPRSFGCFHEPFAGAAAVFFRLHAVGMLHGAVLNDLNTELVAAYAVVRDEVEALIERLRELEVAYLAGNAEERAAFYYAKRAAAPLLPVDRAARLIFLNKTCYNGLYRVNRAGQFNVPHGDYRHPVICDAANLRAVARALEGVELTSLDFEKACAAAVAGDFVYLDPPYQPLSATSRFTSYTSREFGAAEQERLAAVFADLTERGVFAMLSNSEHPFIRKLYEGKGYRISAVSMSRAINSNGARRSAIAELLIENAPALT